MPGASVAMLSDESLTFAARVDGGGSNDCDAAREARNNSRSERVGDGGEISLASMRLSDPKGNGIDTLVAEAMTEPIPTGRLRHSTAVRSAESPISLGKSTSNVTPSLSFLERMRLHVCWHTSCGEHG